jgi:two-component sensor histidine kinase
VAPHELLHRLNNQLGVILAHAELIEQKARTEDERARASQVVQAALQAMAVSRELREQTSREPETLPFGTKVQN